MVQRYTNRIFIIAEYEMWFKIISIRPYHFLSHICRCGLADRRQADKAHGINTDDF